MAESPSTAASPAGSVHDETLFDKVKVEICTDYSRPEEYLEMNAAKTQFAEVSAGM